VNYVSSSPWSLACVLLSSSFFLLSRGEPNPFSFFGLVFPFFSRVSPLCAFWGPPFFLLDCGRSLFQAATLIPPFFFSHSVFCCNFSPFLISLLSNARPPFCVFTFPPYVGDFSRPLFMSLGPPFPADQRSCGEECFSGCIPPASSTAPPLLDRAFLIFSRPCVNLSCALSRFGQFPGTGFCRFNSLPPLVSFGVFLVEVGWPVLPSFC